MAMPRPSQYLWSIVHSRIEVLPTMPSTWSLCTRSLASAAICVGLVCSVLMKYLIGWPLTPPFAFTQLK